MNDRPSAIIRYTVWAVVTFAISLVGSLAAWGLAYWLSRKDDFPGEAYPLEVFIFGTVWAGIASFLTMRSFVRNFGSSSVSPILGGLILAFVTLPLSALLNLPGSTTNPINAVATTSNEKLLYGICMLEYFITTVVVGTVLTYLARMTKFTSTNIVGGVWIALAILYALQLPVAVTVSDHMR